MMNKSAISGRSGSKTPTKSAMKKSINDNKENEDEAKRIMEEKGYDLDNYPQPVDIKYPEELERLTAIEKKIFKKKIELELFEHKHREEIFAHKQKELMEIENAYRYLQGKFDESLKGPMQDRKKTQVCIIESLDGQKEDIERKCR